MNVRRVSIRLVLAFLCSYGLGVDVWGANSPIRGRVVVLGDSITYSGEYVEFLETGLRLSLQPLDFEILNLGLPSETVSGLSEPNHAGGAFPRPDLHERLDRVLAKTKPHIVIACYGMNDGIYYPFSEERFQQFQDGMRRLHERVVKSGTRLIHVTPPVFDPVPIKEKTLPAGLKEYVQPYEGYNEVLDRYTEWLLSTRKEGWEVVDIHGPINALLVSRRRSDSNFTLCRDGVHPGEVGHWLMARPLLAYLGAEEFASFDTPEQFLNTRRQGYELLKLIQARQRLLKDAWLTETAHQRPGMAKGLPLTEAQEKAAELTSKIDALTVRLPAPRISRDAQGIVRISGPTNAVLRYTLDNTEPRQESGQYLAEIYSPWKGTIQARVFAEHDLVSGAIASAEFAALADHPESCPQSAILPVTQNRDWRSYEWAARHDEVVKLQKERHPQILFLGDSITHFFGGEPVGPHRRGEASWQKYYGNRNALNLGFGWDRTENLLWRIQHGELEGVSPKLIVILIGTNNLETNTADEIAEGVSLICEEIHQRTPASKILLLALLPRSPQPDERRKKLAEVNQRISKLDARDTITYLDIGSIFLKPDGTLPVELMDDFLHPTSKGYALFAEAIEPTVVRLLGASIQFSNRFVNPPASARIIKIIHGWPDEPGQQDNLIRSLAGEGFGGVVCNVSFTDYLESEAKWKAFVRAVQKAKEAGFAMWLYDEKGYPSVAAGGLVLKDRPEWEARGLLIAEKRTALGPVTLELPPGRPMLTAAFPVRQGKVVIAEPEQLSSMIQDRKLSWQAPAGQWHILLITEDRLHDGTHAAMSLAEHLPYPNLLMREPTAKFLEVTHNRYAQHLGKNLGQYFVSTFTDEPSLMSLFLRRMPYRVLPWSPDFSAEFKRRRGYAVEPLLSALVVDAGPDSAKARYDFWKTVGELVSTNYFGQIQDWCREHDVLSGGHLLMEENLANHVPLYGDFFQCLRRLDAPSIDCLTSVPEQVPWFIAQLASSAAELENKSVVMCETSDHSQRYRPAGDTRPVRTVSEPEIRGTCNRLIRAGVNAITSYYSFAGLSKEELRRLNEWVGRCCAAVSGGHQVAEIGVVYPVESVWTRFTPSRIYANESAGAVQMEQVFRNVSDALYAAGRDFTYVDSRALCESQVQDGALVHGKLRWRILVLPSVDTLPLKAWENLDRFVSEGGILIAVGSLPANSETDFPSRQVQALAQKLFQEPEKGLKVSTNAKQGAGIHLPTGWTTGLGSLLNRVLPSDVTVNSPDKHDASAIKYTHRRIDGHEVFFVINDGAASWRGELTLAVEGPGEQWDPATGVSKNHTTGAMIPLELPGYGATIFTFAKAKTARPLRSDNSSMLQLKKQELPPATPEIARGEFVREKVERLERDGKPAWRITGTITKSEVDTFLFARFIYQEPLDLRQIDALVLDTVVPDGQRMPGQLLVILHEKGGADYLANSGRILGSPGLDQCWLSPANFQLAGWSTDTDARLDLAEITEIRVGWGGYLGEETETVEFTISPPTIATLPKTP